MTRRFLFRSLVGIAAAPVAVKAAPIPCDLSQVERAVRGGMLTVTEARKLLGIEVSVDAEPLRGAVARSVQRVRESGFLTQLERQTRKDWTVLQAVHDKILEDLIINGDPDAPKPQITFNGKAPRRL